MDNYNIYVTAVNKIFGYLETMKQNFSEQDNLNYIESIEEYKDAVIRNAEKLKNPQQQSQQKVEALGND